MRALLAIMLLLLLLGSADPARAEDPGDLFGPIKKNIESVEERRIIASLQQRQEELDQRAANLDKQQLEIERLKREVDSKLAGLQKTKGELDQLLAQKDEKEQARVKDLSKMYEKMDPVKAAELLADLDRDLAVAILGGVKAKVAGKFLNNMDPKVAARFTTTYSTLKQD